MNGVEVTKSNLNGTMVISGGCYRQKTQDWTSSNWYSLLLTKEDTFLKCCTIQFIGDLVLMTGYFSAFKALSEI